MQIRSISLMFLVTAALLGGCQVSRRPELSQGQAYIVQSSDAATVVDITIRAVNRGPDPFPLTRVEYTVELDGKPALSAARSAQITAHRFSEEEFTIPAVIAGGTRPTSYRVSGTVTFVPPNLVRKVLYDEGLLRPSQSFSFEGPVAASAPAAPVRHELVTEPRGARSEASKSDTKKDEAKKEEPKKDDGKKPAETPPK